MITALTSKDSAPHGPALLPVPPADWPTVPPSPPPAPPSPPGPPASYKVAAQPEHEAFFDDDLTVAQKLMRGCYELYRGQPSGVSPEVGGWGGSWVIDMGTGWCLAELTRPRQHFNELGAP